MRIIQVVRSYLTLHYLVISLTCAVTFTNAQYVQNFLRHAFDIGRRFQPQDVFSSAVDVGRGLLLSAQHAPIPTPAEFFDIGINLIVGFPTEQVFSAINTFCKFYHPCNLARWSILNVFTNLLTENYDIHFLLTGSFSLSQKQVKPKVLPDLKKMNYLLKTPQRDYLIPIQTPEKLWNHQAFDRNLKTAFLVTGWFSNVNSTMENDALETVWEAYKCRGNFNFVVRNKSRNFNELETPRV